MLRWTTALIALGLVACGNGMQPDATVEGGDVVVGDGSDSGGQQNDAMHDAVGDLVTNHDGGDVIAMNDVPRTDVPTSDVPMNDVPVTDVPSTDVPMNMDVPMMQDTGTDVPTTSDVPTMCTGASITVTAPTAGTVIETCSPSGAPIYYTFTATGTGITQVSSEFVHSGTVFAAPSTLTGPPFIQMVQVGGNPTGGMQPLNRLGADANWTWQLTGTDAAGCTVTASQPFTLHYDSNTRTCPNP